LEQRRSGLLDAEDEIDENFFRSPVPRTRRASATSVSISTSIKTSSKNRKSVPSSPTGHGRSLRRANSLMDSPSINSTLSPFKPSSNIITLTTHLESIKIQPLFPTHFVNED